MCTSYHVFPEENVEMRDIISQIVRSFPQFPLRQGRISPTDVAPIMAAEGPRPMRFGMPHPQHKKLLLNARSERAAESPLFSPMLKHSRCLVPANEFFEWNDKKEPFLFSLPSGQLMFMAGLFVHDDPLPRFVVITRDADKQVRPVHNRMPVILATPEYQAAWLRSPQLAQELLTIPLDVPLMTKAG